jgi:hypothetical protein
VYVPCLTAASQIILMTDQLGEAFANEPVIVDYQNTPFWLG